MRLPFQIDRHFRALRPLCASLIGAALLSACGTPGGGGFGSGPGPAVTGSTGTVKVALLLPISASGSTPGVAKALKQAAELALFDFDNPNVSLIPKDTKGTAEGARLAAESALQDGAELMQAIERLGHVEERHARERGELAFVRRGVDPREQIRLHRLERQRPDVAARRWPGDTGHGDRTAYAPQPQFTVFVRNPKQLPSRRSSLRAALA